MKTGVAGTQLEEAAKILACSVRHLLSVHVPNNRVPGTLVIVIVLQVWDKYMILGYLSP